MPERLQEHQINDYAEAFLGHCVLICIEVISMLVQWKAVHGLYDAKTHTLIEEIVCRNVPMLLPFARIAGEWLYWKIIRVLQLDKDRPETGKGANANMAAFGAAAIANWISEKIGNDIWRDLTAVVFLYLLIKTVFLSGHLFLAPLKLRQLFDGKPKNA